jgi:DNA transposition AAA+ family ATPase
MKNFDMRSSNVFWRFSWRGALVVFSELRSSNNIIYSYDGLQEALEEEHLYSTVPRQVMQKALQSYASAKERVAA